MKLKVLFNNIYVGILERNLDSNYVFTYDSEYVGKSGCPIAYKFPLRLEPYLEEKKLHSFFDNLISEGWLKQQQIKTVNTDDCLILFKNFGFDLIGALSILPIENLSKDNNYRSNFAKSRVSISGYQKKILVVLDKKIYRYTNFNELSTHIAKLESDNFENIIELEYLSILAIKSLLPNDDIVDVKIGEVIDHNNEIKKALIVKRFDRSSNNKRVHFEEFNQILNKHTVDKYNGSYEEMGKFLTNEKNISKMERIKLFQRILAYFLIGNTDAHLKNFAIFHDKGNLNVLTPIYDVVASAYYKNQKTLALRLNGIKDMKLGNIKPKHLLKLGVTGFNLTIDEVDDCVSYLLSNINIAIYKIKRENLKDEKIKFEIINLITRRKNGLFSLFKTYRKKKFNK